MSDMKKLYLCDGESCSNNSAPFSICAYHTTDGACYHTSDPSHSLSEQNKLDDTIFVEEDGYLVEHKRAEWEKDLDSRIG